MSCYDVGTGKMSMQLTVRCSGKEQLKKKCRRQSMLLYKNVTQVCTYNIMMVVSLRVEAESILNNLLLIYTVK